MAKFGEDENIKVDSVHAELIRSLILCNKPESVVEFGIGGGKSTDAILDGLSYNKKKYKYTVVDSWLDFGGNPPKEALEKYSSKINIVTSLEKDFVFSCKEKFDFIMSDADHHATNQWFEYVYDNLLNNNGILIYHDINLFDNSYPNLVEIFIKCKNKKLSHMLFNKSSLENERCERGLLVIFKN